MQRKLLPSYFCIAVLTSVLVSVLGCGPLPRTTVTTIPEKQVLSGVDNQLFERSLATLGSNGAVNLSALRPDTNLTAYLRQLAEMRTNLFSSRPAQLAFWLNAHNAYVLDLLRLNQGRQIKTTRDISGFKSAKVVSVGGQFYSLNEIEQEIIRKQFREPRAYFALYEGNKSSPRLWKEPYNEKDLSEQLDRAAHTFLADSTKNRLDAKNNTIYLSQIFSDYSEEFERAAGNLLQFVRAFAPERMAQHIDQHPLVKLQYLTTDWTIF